MWKDTSKISQRKKICRCGGKLRRGLRFWVILLFERHSAACCGSGWALDYFRCLFSCTGSWSPYGIGLYFSKEESESESTACTGTAVHDPGLVGRFFASTSILPSFSRFIVGRLHPSTTLVLLVAFSPSLRSCRRFLDLWLNRARGIPTEALPKFRGEALLCCRHFCSRVQ